MLPVPILLIGVGGVRLSQFKMASAGHLINYVFMIDKYIKIFAKLAKHYVIL